METMSKLEKLLCYVTVYLFILILGFVWMASGHADEWMVKVCGFDFQTAEVLLEDEDGYVWTCPFGEHDWAVGQEYVLVLEDGVNPQIKDC